MAGKLAPSLLNLFGEINRVWPHRDKRTDGWYASPSDRKTKGHNPGHNGYSHAIDVDKDGIDQMLLINRLKKSGDILWYVIWNRKLYSNTYDWVPQPYTKDNPHTDHLHIEIYQTTKAETFSGKWGVDTSRNIPDDDGPIYTPPDEVGTSDIAFVPNLDGRDYSGYLSGLGSVFSAVGGLVDAQGKSIRSMRR